MSEAISREVYAGPCQPPALASVVAHGTPNTLLILFAHRSPKQASDSAKEQVRLGAAGVAVHGLSVLGDAGLINSHVLAFR